MDVLEEDRVPSQLTSFKWVNLIIKNDEPTRPALKRSCWISHSPSLTIIWIKGLLNISGVPHIAAVGLTLIGLEDHVTDCRR